MIEVCVLGPVEVRAPEAGTPGGYQQQAVLAILVAAGGRVVPADRIVDQVWGGDPPASATATLQAYISRLRRLLEPDRAPRTAPQILVSEAAGYALRLPAAQVDAWRFERDVTRSPDLAPQDAVAVLRDALALWRGVPYEQFADEEWARAEITRLTELRCAAQERAVTAMLRVGRIAEAVPAAQALADAEPLRGEAWRLLALGLWAAHRSADALDALRRHREHLADELGLDPEPALSTLEQAILEQRGEVLEEAVGTDRGSHLRPAQLPRSAAGFAARSAEIGALNRLADSALAVISGAGGVGKTTLAVRWAHTVAGRYPDGQLYADLRGFGPEENPADPADVLFGFLTALGLPDHRIPPSLDERVALFRSVLAGRRMLLLLDNAAGAEQVRPLLPGAPGCAVLVTSRSHLGGLVVAEGAHTLRLDAFDDDEARNYLRGRLGSTRVDSEPDARDAIVARCGGLPLALAVVCARAAIRSQFSLSAIAAELRDEHGLDAFTVAGFKHDLRAVLSWSYRQLPDGAAGLFRHLALHPGPDVSRAAAISVAGDAARGQLRLLCDAHLLDERSPGRYVYHDLARAYALELGSPTPDVLVEHYLFSAANADKVCFPYRQPRRVPPVPAGIRPETFADQKEAYAWQDTEYDTLMAYTEICAPAYLKAFFWVLSPYQQDVRFHLHDSIALARRALAVAEADGDRWWVGFLQYAIGRAYLRLNQIDQSVAALEVAIAVGRETNDPIRLAHGLLSMATGIVGVHGVPTREQTIKAYPYAVEALAAYRKMGGAFGRVEEANALHPIAWYHFHRPDGREKARELLQESIDINVGSEQPHAAAGSWLHLARFHAASGDPARAVAAFEEALRLYGDMQDLRIEPLIGLYTTHLAAGDEEAANRARAEAVSLLETASYPDIERIETILGPRPAG
ncbi:DNA-binding SARP family transcriptional activator [Actinoplanes tereljensis]|uniref:SARP family transcriptional regulator n=1 Tax=Paractinoplanes tereljensis TaxID=571912 RepID=A0A919TZB0_9ACTN|nr:BTAD domain-containing putative transcriptional regulator [Actinoplanes tereljensis]GIF26075.1 SARP family transcriptional regulator [Actinoplanes tereljensis]